MAWNRLFTSCEPASREEVVLNAEVAPRSAVKFILSGTCWLLLLREWTDVCELAIHEKEGEKGQIQTTRMKSIIREALDLKGNGKDVVLTGPGKR